MNKNKSQRDHKAHIKLDRVGRRATLFILAKVSAELHTGDTT